MECRGRPVDGGDAGLLHLLKQEHGEGEVFFIENAARRAEAERLVDVLAGEVKVERRLIAEDVVLGVAAEFAHPVGKVDHRAVRDDDTLGRTGGAGGEEQVERIKVDDLFAKGGEECLVWFRRESVLHENERRAVGDQLGGGAVGLSKDDGGGAHLLEDLAHTRLRHVVVDGDVTAAGVEHALHGRDALCGAADEHRDGAAQTGGRSGQVCAEALRAGE